MHLGIRPVLLLALLSGCAHLPLPGNRPPERTVLWEEAQQALAAEDFGRAEAVFQRLVHDHGPTLEGRESLFYLGAIRLDPRNTAWNSKIGEARLQEYLDHMALEDGPRLYRYPEAQTLHEIARQLNLPPDSRVAVLQPEERVVTVEQRVVVPAEQSRELAAEVQRLRQQVADRDATIRQQQEELDRIRRTLTGPGPGRS